MSLLIWFQVRNLHKANRKNGYCRQILRFVKHKCGGKIYRLYATNPCFLNDAIFLLKFPDGYAKIILFLVNRNQSAMEKKLTKAFDAIDIKILNELQRNGKISNIDLSKKVGLSPTPCLERVKRLEKQGAAFHSGLPCVAESGIIRFAFTGDRWNYLSSRQAGCVWRV